MNYEKNTMGLDRVYNHSDYTLHSISNRLIRNYEKSFKKRRVW